MDVRCDRCGTEYEFDDARVTESGVAVKCTTCGHVFKIKRQGHVTVPVTAKQASDAPETLWAEGPPDASSPPARAAPENREWQVRQSSGGGVIAFRELTTLQKWIVERKLIRDDEITLTGQTWRRLGEIPELQSFFQVVDEANLARLMSLPAEPRPTRTPQPSFELRETPVEEMHAQVRSDRGSRPADGDDFDAPSSAGWRLLVALLAVAAAVGLYLWWPRLSPRSILRPSPPESQAEPPLVPLIAVDAGATAEAVVDAGSAAPVASEPRDAGTPLKRGATPPKVSAIPSTGGAGPTFDTLLLRADRLREADDPEAALGAYRKAIDLKPTRAEPFAGRGLAYLDMGQPAMAEAEFKQALRLDPRSGKAIMGLAETYRVLGRKEDAIEYYQLYLEELPKGPEAAVAQTQIQRLQE